MPEGELWLIVSRDRLDVHEELQQLYGTSATITLDRRHDDRRHGVRPVKEDRRREDRRQPLSPLQQDMLDRFGYFVVGRH
jgi:hypothetical protein